ncbi:MAG: permease [Acutalibacteraceae bacterium]|nr:permease [Acutalibacteraceae bacterium]
MSLFGGVIPVTGITFLMFCIFGILFVGYALGRITIKGVSLGDAGVFVIALLFGALFFVPLENQLIIKGAVEVGFAEKALEIVESLGLILFVTSVGFIAGPKFFGNMKKNFKSYVLLGLVIILFGGLSAVACIFIGRGIGFGGAIETSEGFTAMIVGLLSGSLTSTPAFSAAKATVADEYTSLVSVGHGIAYIFGVIGVVLFVQIIPKITKADMAAERKKISISADKSEKKSFKGKLLSLDGHGFAAFALAAILGIFVGKIMIPLSGDGLSGTCFSLTTTGGCLLASLVFGHFGRIGKLNIMPEQSTLKLFRELGLVLFLVGAGIPGGADFVANFDPMYFVYGIIMTTIPLIAGYLFAKYVLKLSLLNNLGSITGGMTSTPALGTLISTAGTEDVAAAYAATYPIALIAVVLVSQFLIILF